MLVNKAPLGKYRKSAKWLIYKDKKRHEEFQTGSNGMQLKLKTQNHPNGDSDFQTHKIYITELLC